MSPCSVLLALRTQQGHLAYPKLNCLAALRRLLSWSEPYVALSEGSGQHLNALTLQILKCPLGTGPCWKPSLSLIVHGPSWIQSRNNDRGDLCYHHSQLPAQAFPEGWCTYRGCSQVKGAMLGWAEEEGRVFVLGRSPE